MRSIALTAGLSLLLGLTGCAAKAQEGTQGPSPIDWNRVATALGKAGAVQPGGVYKVGMPRSDLHVTVGGVRIKPAKDPNPP